MLSDDIPFDGIGIVSTRVSSVGDLHGCGRGRVSGFGVFSGQSNLRTDQTVGFGVWKLARKGKRGGEVLRIFDFVVRGDC